MWSGTGHGPTPHPDMIVMTGQWMSVPNFYTVKGLEILGELAAAAGSGRLLEAAGEILLRDVVVALSVGTTYWRVP